MRSARKIIQVILIGLVVIFFSLFAFQNEQDVSLHFLNHETPTWPLFMVIIGCFLGGVLISGFVSLVEILRLNRTVRKQRKEIKNLEQQLVEMKQQPLLEGFGSEPKAVSEDDHEEPVKRSKSFF